MSHNQPKLHPNMYVGYIGRYYEPGSGIGVDARIVAVVDGAHVNIEMVGGSDIIRNVEISHAGTTGKEPFFDVNVARTLPHELMQALQTGVPQVVRHLQPTMHLRFVERQHPTLAGRTQRYLQQFWGVDGRIGGDGEWRDIPLVEGV